MCSIFGIFDLRPGATCKPLRPLALALSAAPAPPRPRLERRARR